MTSRPVEMSERVLTDARKRPIKALAEAIWNSLDAGADHAAVEFEFTDMGAISAITVVDDGAGMNRERADLDFHTYGDSWKARIDARTHNGRSIHGQRGQGRYDILNLGTGAQWSSVSEQIDGTTGWIVASLAVDDRRQYAVGEATPHAGSTGTTLRIANVTEDADRELNRLDLADTLATDFALYLRQYPQVEITVGGDRVDPSVLHLDPADIEVTVGGVDDPVVVTVIEWRKRHKGTQRIHLCDSNGASLLDVAAELRSGDFNFTAYIRWDGFKDPNTSAGLAILGGDDAGARVYEAGREAVRGHVVKRAEAKRARLVEDWKQDKSYPFQEEPKDVPEEAVRKSFDVAAVAASPVLAGMDVEQRKFSMRLLKVAIETDPSALQTVLREVLRLPEEQVQEMAALFDHTSLGSMITATRNILNRLAFLSGLRTMVFVAESKKATTERRQLHRILERESWLFGDEWTLTASDETLRRVLVKHLRELGDEVEYSDVMPQSQAEGEVLIPDLVLSSSASSYSKHLEYLVVELKRPSVTLGKQELDQIEAYAIAVTDDEQFSQPNITWEFWLIGNNCNEYIERKLQTPGHPHGVALIAPKYRVHVRTWAEVISDSEHRHRFVQEALQARTDEQTGMAYLKQVHAALLPDVLKEPA
jgi:hypothetical protein